MDREVTNWAGNVSFGAARLHEPTSLARLQEVVAGSRRVRALGTGHSFNRIADTTGDLVSLAKLPAEIEIDSDRRLVQLSGGVRYGELAGELNRHGFALHNLGSLPHISVAGACATATHGSGETNANLATAVAGLDLVGPDGELRTLSRAEPTKGGPDAQLRTLSRAEPSNDVTAGEPADEFAGSVVGLGSLGILGRLRLEIEPAFQVRQQVYDDLPHQQLLENLDEILATAYSISLFTEWRTPPVYQVWLKYRVREQDPWAPEPAWFGATPAGAARNPLPTMTGENCTQQLGVIGPWHERLPHFRLEFKPSRGDELQTEYLLPRRFAGHAIEALAGIGQRLAPVLRICEIRTVAADQLWLSPSYQQDSLALHFTWALDSAAVTPVVAEIERRLAPFGARPHWGKVFCTPPQVLSQLYPRFADFVELLTLRDPAGKFHNELIDTLFGLA